jgi:hypothetical protein
VDVAAPAAATEAAPAAAAAAPKEKMDVMTALKLVLKNAIVVDGLRRGIRECVKALDKYVATPQCCFSRSRAGSSPCQAPGAPLRPLLGLRQCRLCEARREPLQRAQDQHHQGRGQQAARRVGWSLQDRQGRQRPQGRRRVGRRRDGTLLFCPPACLPALLSPLSCSRARLFPSATVMRI